MCSFDFAALLSRSLFLDDVPVHPPLDRMPSSSSSSSDALSPKGLALLPPGVFVERLSWTEDYEELIERTQPDIILACDTVRTLDERRQLRARCMRELLAHSLASYCWFGCSSRFICLKFTMLWPVWCVPLWSHHQLREKVPAMRPRRPLLQS